MSLGVIGECCPCGSGINPYCHPLIGVEVFGIETGATMRESETTVDDTAVKLTAVITRRPYPTTSEYSVGMNGVSGPGYDCEGKVLVPVCRGLTGITGEPFRYRMFLGDNDLSVQNAVVPFPMRPRHFIFSVSGRVGTDVNVASYVGDFAPGQFVLLTGQTDAVENGVWLVRDDGLLERFFSPTPHPMFGKTLHPGTVVTAPDGGWALATKTPLAIGSDELHWHHHPRIDRVPPYDNDYVEHSPGIWRYHVIQASTLQAPLGEGLVQVGWYDYWYFVDTLEKKLYERKHRGTPPGATGNEGEWVLVGDLDPDDGEPTPVLQSIYGDYIHVAYGNWNWGNSGITEAQAGFTRTYDITKPLLSIYRTGNPAAMPVYDYTYEDGGLGSFQKGQNWYPTDGTPLLSTAGGGVIVYAPAVEPAIVPNGGLVSAHGTYLLVRCDPAKVPAPCGYSTIGQFPPVCTLILTYPEFAQLPAELDYEIVRADCGCSHLISETADCISYDTAESDDADPGKVKFAVGEWKKPVFIPVIPHTGPEWWGCLDGNGVPSSPLFPSLVGAALPGHETGVIFISNLVATNVNTPAGTHPPNGNFIYDQGFASTPGNIVPANATALSVLCAHPPGPPAGGTFTQKTITAVFVAASGFPAFNAACATADPAEAGYLGYWNAANNSPAISDFAFIYFGPVPTRMPEGAFLRVFQDGGLMIDGENVWADGDIVYSNGQTWEKKPGNFRTSGNSESRRTWRKKHTEGQHEGVDNSVEPPVTTTVLDSHTVEYHQKSYPRIKEDTVVGNPGYVNGDDPICDPTVYGNGTSTTGVDSFNWSLTDGSAESSGTLSEENSDAEDEAIIAEMLAEGDFGDPAKWDKVIRVAPGENPTDPDTYAPFADANVLPNDNVGGDTGNNVVAARYRTQDVNGQRTYIMRRREFTVTWNDEGKPYPLRRVYLEIGITGGATERIEMTSGVPYVVEPPDEWGQTKWIHAITNDRSFECHPGL